MPKIALKYRINKQNKKINKMCFKLGIMYVYHLFGISLVGIIIKMSLI